MAEQVNAAPNPNPAEAEEGMSLMEHMKELRDRLFKAVIALVVGAAIGLAFSEQILQVIIRPYGNTLLVTSPTESITNIFTVSLTVGAFLAMPFIVYQILAFVMPGLLPQEKKWVYAGVPAATGLFLLGATFAWFIMLPAAVDFLTSIYPSVFKYDLKPDEYVPFITGVVFWIGVAFEMPLLIFILAKANVVTARVLARGWRFAIVGIAIIAALITPTPDPINMSIVMTPLLLLYLLSIGMAALARQGKITPALLDPDETLPADSEQSNVKVKDKDKDKDNGKSKGKDKQKGKAKT